MASSSVSQDDVEADFEMSSRRTRIRTARARQVNPLGYRAGEMEEECDGSEHISGSANTGDFDASPKPAIRIKEKRINRPNHTNKGKMQRDRRKLREKRRSTGVVHLPSTESTGGSTGEDEDLLSMTSETRRNTHYNENLEKKEDNQPNHSEHSSKNVPRTKSPSDLEADDEDNQDYDSLTLSDSTLSVLHTASSTTGSKQASTIRSNGRLPSPSSTRTVEEQLVYEKEENKRLLQQLEENKRLFQQLEERNKKISSLEFYEENKRLLQLLEEKNKKISSLESYVSQITLELSELTTERSNLRQENSTLIRAMGSLSSK